MFTATGTLIYDPRSEKSAFLPYTCVLRLDDSIANYYCSWIKKESGIHLNFPIWKFHCTVVRGEKPQNPLAWKKHAGRKIEVCYSPEIQNSEKYFWLSVYCQELSKIRRELGLKSYPKVPFHATVGNRKNVNQEKIKGLKLPSKMFPWERPEYFNRNY